MPTIIPEWKNCDFLLPITKEVLLDLANCPFLEQFALVGGSGLALYLQHRLSEDLDFFSWEKEVNTLEILEALNHVFGSDYQILQQTEKQLDLSIKGVKTTFFAKGKPLSAEARYLLQGKAYVAHLDVITQMKLGTIFQRAKYRDYYDLYVLSRETYSIQELYELAVIYIQAITPRLFQMAVTYTTDVQDESTDYLQLKYNIGKKEIGLWFEEAVKEWLKG
ncbi:MAG: nucleotidyl transferase AbiEii/AbiGii toxin family protein [Saprospiraceae bacterium]